MVHQRRQRLQVQVLTSLQQRLARSLAPLQTVETVDTMQAQV